MYRTTQSGLYADRECFRLLHVVKMTIAPQEKAAGFAALARHANFVKLSLFAVGGMSSCDLVFVLGSGICTI